MVNIIYKFKELNRGDAAYPATLCHLRSLIYAFVCYCAQQTSPLTNGICTPAYVGSITCAWCTVSLRLPGIAPNKRWTSETATKQSPKLKANHTASSFGNCREADTSPPSVTQNATLNMPFCDGNSHVICIRRGAWHVTSNTRVGVAAVDMHTYINSRGGGKTGQVLDKTTSLYHYQS